MNTLRLGLNILRTLVLSRNRLRSIEGSVFSNLCALNSLDLCNNQLETINFKEFSKSSLETLNLPRNLIRRIDSQSFSQVNDKKS